MDKQVFTEQMRRLTTTYPERAYPQPRVEIIWQRFKDAPDAEFAETVTECIANCRQAPLLNELTKAFDEIHARNTEQRERDFQLTRTGTIAEVLHQAASKSDSEFAKKCVELVEKRTKGEITKAQFEQGCDYLDEVANLMGKGNCPECNNDGYTRAFNGEGNVIYRCFCSRGSQKPGKIRYRNPATGQTEEIEIAVAPRKYGERK